MGRGRLLDYESSHICKNLLSLSFYFVPFLRHIQNVLSFLKIKTFFNFLQLSIHPNMLYFPQFTYFLLLFLLLLLLSFLKLTTFPREECTENTQKMIHFLMQKKENGPKEGG
jgi:hypothetical protein